MPDEAMWAEFFSPSEMLTALGLHYGVSDAVDFGCGYGTFAVPAAKIIRGELHAIDIDPTMVAATRAKAEAEGLRNLRAYERDFMSSGTGLRNGIADYAMLFNILHCEEPSALLTEAWRVLRPGGVLAVMHWNYDPSTPRGPSIEIRPKPEQCMDWVRNAGFLMEGSRTIDLPPHHYGFVGQKPGKA
jgi:ubiquinone/menaquinone biosynthesis C-methylase UbiE